MHWAEGGGSYGKKVVINYGPFLVGREDISCVDAEDDGEDAISCRGDEGGGFGVDTSSALRNQFAV